MKIIIKKIQNTKTLPPPKNNSTKFRTCLPFVLMASAILVLHVVSSFIFIINETFGRT